MTVRFDWPASAAAPTREAALALQGITGEHVVSPRIDSLFARALTMYGTLATPRAVATEVTIDEFRSIYRGEGRNESVTPLAEIFPKASRLALVAATIGSGLTDTVKQLFDNRDVALGCMLDAIGSAAADRLAELAAVRFRSEFPVADDAHVLNYSPGYCGWHVSGQRALFAFLQPQTIGITLNANCLMQPLKSTSGVLIAADAAVHRFRPAYTFCERCRDKPCVERMRLCRS